MTTAKSINLELLIKLLKLSTSSNDAEALLALRKAHEVLTKFGGDWEALLHGKVTVIADPFAPGSAIPTGRHEHASPPSAPAPPRAPQAPHQPPPASQWPKRYAHAPKQYSYAQNVGPAATASPKPLRRGSIKLDELA